MLINLTDVFTSEGKTRKESLLFEPDAVSHMGNVYKICEKTPMDIAFSNIGTGKVLMKGTMKLVLEIPCDRCLQIVKEPLEIYFEEEILSPDAMAQSENSEEYEQEYLNAYELDTEALMNSEILINMPVKVLCRPDCKGICKQCGHNLNEGSCGCDTFVPDPRMAAIKDIFNANKEV